MLLRPLILSATVLLAALTLSTKSYAKENETYKSEKTDTSYAFMSVKNNSMSDIEELGGFNFLIDSIQIETNVDVVTIHIMALADSRVVKEISSNPLSLRKRPGRLKLSVKNLIETEELTTALSINGFATPKIDATLTNESGVEALAMKVFRSIEQSDGIFVVATWDDMIKGDQSRGLVGFGSWN